MRMWMIDPKLMCDRHLLGEHAETHMLAGSLRRGRSIMGFLKRGLLEPKLVCQRHDDLASEMLRRKMQHQSKMYVLEQLYSHFRTGFVNPEKSLADLMERCPSCRSNILEGNL